jgi:hypothetical protein
MGGETQRLRNITHYALSFIRSLKLSSSHWSKSALAAQDAELASIRSCPFLVDIMAAVRRSAAARSRHPATVSAGCFDDRGLRAGRAAMGSKLPPSSSQPFNARQSAGVCRELVDKIDSDLGDMVFTFGKREHDISQSQDACGHSR